MNIDGKPYRSIWLNADGWTVDIIDQTLLPHDFSICSLTCSHDAARAIRSMQVRGAPLIGATAAYGMALAMRENSDDGHVGRTAAQFLETRPTAVNLHWALSRMTRELLALPDIDGAYELEAGPGGAQCRRTSATPDLEMGIETLGARYLGAHRFATFARAGLVRGDDAAITTADRMFDWSALPWCPEDF